MLFRFKEETQTASRINSTIKNVFSGIFTTFVMLIFPFASRTIFIYVLNTEYLGINGLFTNILGVLSFSELGIGVAITFSLYKPLAENDIEKIKSIMHLYRRIYEIIAVIIMICGLCLLPFLKYIIKGGADIEYLQIYYIIFLFNSAFSYLLIYKQTLLIADQKNYILSNINAVAIIIKTIIGCVVLIVFRNYIAYLLIDVFFGIIKNLYINHEINKVYPYLLSKDHNKMDKSELEPIKKNVKALILHKVGGISVYQSDNIIISSFIGVISVGILSNYTMIINCINQFAGIMFSSATASFGNVIISEKSEKKYELFKVYNFLGFWIYGCTSICLFNLIQPFIIGWIGGNMLIPFSVVFLIVINYYITGMRAIVENVKGAAGLYNNDKYISLMQGGINLIISIALVIPLGIFGVYIGTIVSGILPLIIRPYIIYKNIFNVKVEYYFHSLILYSLIITVIGIAVFIINYLFFSRVTVLNFIIRSLICIILPNITIFLIYRKSKEYLYLKEMLYKLLNKGAANK